MKRIKDPIEFLLENGLIFEFNRKVLHPLGLALEVDIRETDDNKQETYLKLWECPLEDQEGFLFTPDVFKLGTEKYNKFKGQSSIRIDKRLKTLGYIEQEKESL